MGFVINSKEQRVRINLSIKAASIINEDMLIFGEDDRSSFFNRIFSHYYENAKASASIYLENAHEKASRNLSSLTLSSNERHISLDSIDFLLEQEILYYIQSLLSHKGKSDVYRINNKNFEYLTGEDCKEPAYYKNHPGLYLKCILEEYAALQYKERESIYYQPAYQLVREACMYHQILKIQTQNGTWHHFYPYKLTVDPLATQYYLIGYIRHLDDPTETENACSLRIPKLTSIRKLSQTFHLSREKITLLEEQCAKRSVPYLVGEETDILVHLTEEGAGLYRQLIAQRPASLHPIKKEGDYTFLCTERQAEIYFRRFGKDAVILSPLSLKSKMEKHYQEALLSYTKYPMP